MRLPCVSCESAAMTPSRNAMVVMSPSCVAPLTERSTSRSAVRQSCDCREAFPMPHYRRLKARAQPSVQKLLVGRSAFGQLDIERPLKARHGLGQVAESLRPATASEFREGRQRLFADHAVRLYVRVIPFSAIQDVQAALQPLRRRLRTAMHGDVEQALG